MQETSMLSIGCFTGQTHKGEVSIHDICVCFVDDLFNVCCS